MKAHRLATTDRSVAVPMAAFVHPANTGVRAALVHAFTPNCEIVDGLTPLSERRTRWTP